MLIHITETSRLSKPEISIVIEGYNEKGDLGTADETLEALSKQIHPIDRIELILVGDDTQVGGWKDRFRDVNHFHAIKYLAVEGNNYFGLKNAGADLATGEIIAFMDSDVLPKPRWVGSIVDTIKNRGSDVCMGPTLFRQPGGMSSDHIFMRIAASMAWGWILGKPDDEGLPTPRGFMDHNIAMRAEHYEDHKYKTDLGRLLGSMLLFRSFMDGRLKAKIAPGQQGEHQFSWWYWLIGLQFRYGNEVYRLRRMDKDYPNQWISKTSIFEPIVTMLWHMMLDIPRWLRLTRILETSVVYRFGTLPLVVFMSAMGRGCEMCGMYATMIRPKETRRWAEAVGASD